MYNKLNVCAALSIHVYIYIYNIYIYIKNSNINENHKFHLEVINYGGSSCIMKNLLYVLDLDYMQCRIGFWLT